MNNYQLDYAEGRPQMYDKTSRGQKAHRIIKTLETILGENKLRFLTVLDIGSSTGIIDNILATKFKKLVGVDIDKKAVEFSKKQFKRKNLEFRVEDALNLPFKEKSFDVIICTHIYEHVPDAGKLFSEIYRVLKVGGVCYLAAVNKIWPWEVHHNLLFLSWLPQSLANTYLKLTRRGNEYYERPKTYWGLQKLTRRFKRLDYTKRIFQDPKKFGYDDLLPPPISHITWLLSPILKYFSPTFFWLLVKK